MTLDTDGWKTLLQQAAGTIAGVEIDHPNNHALEVAAKPFLDYVRGISDAGEEVKPLPFDESN